MPAVVGMANVARWRCFGLKITMMAKLFDAASGVCACFGMADDDDVAFPPLLRPFERLRNS